MKHFAVTLFAVLVPLAAFGETPASNQFRQATPIGPDEPFPSEFGFTAGQWKCRITATGKAGCVFGSRKWWFTVSTGAGRIERLFSSGNGPVVLAYELTDDESNWGTVVGVLSGARQEKWKAHVRGLNLATPIERGGSVFVAASGFVASIDSSDGHFNWRHECLYDGSGWTATELTLTADTVIVNSFNVSHPADHSLSCYAAVTGVFVTCP